MNKVSVNNPLNLLKVSDLSMGLRSVNNVFLVRAIKRFSRLTSEPYLSFYFRTGDGCVIRGNRFDLSFQKDIGFDLLNAQRRVVEIQFEVSVHLGIYTLIIEHIKLSPDVGPENFFAEYSDTEKSFKELNEAAIANKAKSVSPKFKHACVFNINYGKKGGFIELVYGAYSILKCANVENVSELIRIFMSVLESYFVFLQMKDKYDYVPKTDIIYLLKNCENASEESRMNSILADTLSALMELAEPEHLYAHFIVRAFRESQERLQDLEKVKLAPKNIIICEDNKRLIYY